MDILWLVIWVRFLWSPFLIEISTPKFISACTILCLCFSSICVTQSNLPIQPLLFILSLKQKQFKTFHILQKITILHLQFILIVWLSVLANLYITHLFFFFLKKEVVNIWRSHRVVVWESNNNSNKILY